MGRTIAAVILVTLSFFGTVQSGSAQSLQLITTVPGTIFDTDGQRVLYLNNQNQVVIRTLANGAETVLPSVANQTPKYGFLGPLNNPTVAPQGGAIFAAEGQDATVTTLLLVTSSNVAINLGQLNGFQSVRVSGNYAVWNGQAVGRSKTDQEGEGTTIAIVPGTFACPVKATREWIDTSEITGGPLFRPISKAGRVLARRLSDRAVAEIVKAAARRVGLKAEEFSGHSLRAGFLTSAARRGASIFKMMDVSRHKSVDTLRGYVRDAELFRDHAGSGLL